MKEKLKQYLIRAFSQAPKNKKNQELQEEILANLYEKYEDCLAHGMSEEEAYRTTVESIGDLSSLFDMDASTDQEKESDVPQEEPSVPLYDEATCNKKKTAYEVGLTCSIMLYILSVVPVILFESSLWAVCAMFFLIAFATGSILYLTNTKPILVPISLSEQEKQRLRAKRAKSAALLAICVMLYILCVCPTILLYEHENIGVVLMFVIIALATGGIILRGYLFPSKELKGIAVSSTDTQETQKKDAPPQKEGKKTVSSIVFSVISGIFWACICLIYFGYSFYTGNWTTSWLIFIYGALLYAIAHGVFRLIIGKHRVGAVVKIVVCSLLLVTFFGGNLILMDGISFNFGSSALIYDDTRYEIGNAEFSSDTEIQNLDIEWLEGDVTVQYWDKDYISMEEECDTSLKQSEQMRYDVSGNTLTIKAQSSRWIAFGNLPSKSLTVYLPQQTKLNFLTVSGINATVCVDEIEAKRAKINTVSADIDLLNVSLQELHVETVSGQITLIGAAEDLEFDSVSGNLDLTFHNTPREIAIDGVSASATVTLSEDILGYSVEFDSVSGKCTLPDRSAMKQDEGTEIEFDSVSGDLTILLS